MKSLPANLIIEKNKLSTAGVWVILLEVTLTDTPATTLRFARNTEDVVFEGETYTAFPFEIDTTQQTSKGEIPSITVRVSNIQRMIQPYLEDLDGGIGSAVKITVINTKYLNEDYAELEMTFDVLATQSNSRWITFTLGAPNPLRQRFPLYRFIALHCRFGFNRPVLNYPECGYSGEAIEAITLPSGNPVSIQVTGHPFSDSDILSFSDIGGTTELTGNSYQITETDSDNFTLDGTDGDDFSAWTSDGTVGYATCNRTLIDCRERDNSTRFGGFPAMRSGAIRVV